MKEITSKELKWMLPLAVVALLLEWILPIHHHSERWWNHVPGFYALYGFISCVAIIVVSKKLGKLFIQKKEGYYDER